MEAFEIINALSLGILLGCFTGLMPGIHINTIAFSFSILTFLDNVFLVVVISAMSVTHCFIDLIPSILIGASDKCENPLPTHRFLLRGQGFYALRLALLGSILGLYFSLLVSPFFIFFISRYFSILKSLTLYVLVISIFLMLFSTEKENLFWSFIVIFLSGFLGLLALNNFQNSILPLTTGFFAGASLLYSSITNNREIKRQVCGNYCYNQQDIVKSLFGTIASAFISIFPALGPNNTLLLLKKVYSKIDEKAYLTISGAINTASTVFAFLVLFVLGKTRTGSALAIKNLVYLDNNMLFLILFCCLVAGSISYFLADFFAILFFKLFSSLNYLFVNLSIFLFLIFFITVFSGFIGLILFLTSSAIGLIANSSGIRRSNAMSFLIIPTIFYYLG
ncbi:MAG: tripartite tricarboxylate transporter permease [Candidatus Diapherotrites archaeon]|nr:tripartite tricarboxylate transporter permease [Candidatus Diapherotrites archaeon]